MMLKLLLTVTVGVVCVQGGVRIGTRLDVGAGSKVRGRARVNVKRMPDKVPEFPKKWVEDNYKYNLKQTVVSFLPSNKHNGKGDRTSQATVYDQYTEQAEDGSITRKYVLNLGTEGLATVNEDWIVKVVDTKYNVGDLVRAYKTDLKENHENKETHRCKVTNISLHTNGNKKDIVQYELCDRFGKIFSVPESGIDRRSNFNRPRSEKTKYNVERTVYNVGDIEAKYNIGDKVKSHKPFGESQSKSKYTLTATVLDNTCKHKTGVLEYELMFLGQIKSHFVPEDWITGLSRRAAADEQDEPEI